MKKSNLINVIILGLSLIISVAGISIVFTNASTQPGDNSGVYKPINESDIDQTKEGGFQSLEEIKAPKFTDNSPGTSEAYYLDPNSTSKIKNMTFDTLYNSWVPTMQLDLDGWSNFNSLNSTGTIDVLGYFSTASGTSSNFYGNLYMKGGSTLDLQSGSKLILAGGTYADVYSTVDFKDGSNLLLAGTANATFYGNTNMYNLSVNSIKDLDNPSYILDPSKTSTINRLVINNSNINQSGLSISGGGINAPGQAISTGSVIATSTLAAPNVSAGTALGQSATATISQSGATFSRNVVVPTPTVGNHAATKAYVDNRISPFITNISTLTSRLNSITQQQISSINGNSGVNKTSGQSMSTATSNKDICALSRVRFDPDNENVHPDAQCEIVGNKNNWTLRARSASNNLITVSCNWTCFNID